MARLIDGERQNIIGINIKKARQNARLSQGELSIKLELA